MFNEEPAYMLSELSAYDVIELGKSKFLFVAFCLFRRSLNSFSILTELLIISSL